MGFLNEMAFFHFKLTKWAGAENMTQTPMEKSQMMERDPGKSNLTFIQIYKNVQN
jgi:hypothetical protein